MDDGFAEELEPSQHVVAPDGGTNLHYDLWCFTSPLGVTIQCIVVSPVEERYLLAVPHQVWHRQVARRVLPAQMLAKPIAVEVACCAEDSRDVMEESAALKIWAGYVSSDVYAGLTHLDPEQAVDYRFKTKDSTAFIPFAESLVEVLQEHYAFLSAESGEHPLQPDAGAVDLTSRVSSLEAALGKMADSIDAVLQKVSETRAPSQHVKFTEPLVTKPTRVKKDVRAEKFPGMDPAVVSAALAAGVTEENLVEMQRMMGAAGGTAKKLREPALRARVKTAAAEVLSESDEAEEPPGEHGSAEPSGANPIEGALTKLTELVSLLAADRVKKAKTSQMDLALDGLVAGSSGDTTSSSVGKRAAAARRALRAALVDTPEEISAVVERLLLEDLTNQTVAYGMPKVELNARAWIEHRSKIGAYKTSAHCAWSAGGILDDLIRGRYAHARARAGLLLLQLDQCAVHKGDWTLACELSLEQGPPLSALATHSPPRVAEGESPFSKLLDSRWSEVMLSHLRDAEDYVQKRRNLGKKLMVEDSHSEPAKPKAKAKAKGKATAQHEPNTDA
eukprot:s81_g20.t1